MFLNGPGGLVRPEDREFTGDPTSLARDNIDSFDINPCVVVVQFYSQISLEASDTYHSVFYP